MRIYRLLIIALLLVLPLRAFADSSASPSGVSVINYGANPSSTNTIISKSITVDSTDKNATFTGALGNFVAGENVVLVGAGATSSLATPTAPTVTPETTLNSDEDGHYHAAYTAGGAIPNPGCVIDQSASVPAWAGTTSYSQFNEIQATVGGIAYIFFDSTSGSNTSGGSTPSWAGAIPGGANVWGGAWSNGNTVTDSSIHWSPIGLVGTGSNTGCATTYIYQLVAIDASGGHSAPSTAASGTITNGPAVLSVTNALKIPITGETGAVAWEVFSCSGAACTPTLTAILPQMGAVGSNFNYLDIGNHFGYDNALASGTTLPGAATAQNLNMTIASIGSGTLTLTGTQPSVNGAVTMYPDDEPAFAAARTAAQSSTPPLPVFIPCGTYSFGQSFSVTNDNQQLYYGQPTSGGNCADILWNGSAGGAMISGSSVQNTTFRGFNLNALASAQNDYAAVGFDIDEGASNHSTHDTWDTIGVDSMAVGWRMSNTGTSNVENMTWRDIVQGRSAGSAWDKSYNIWQVGNNAQTDQWRILGANSIGYAGTDIVFAYCNLGSVYARGFLSSNGYNFFKRLVDENAACTTTVQGGVTLSYSFLQGVNRVGYDTNGNNANPLYLGPGDVIEQTTPGDSWVVDWTGEVDLFDSQFGAAAPSKILHQTGASSNTACTVIIGDNFRAGGDDNAPIFANGGCVEVPPGNTNFGQHVASFLSTWNTLSGGTGTTTGATSGWQGSSATITASSTDYIGQGQDSATAAQGTEASIETIIPFAATLSNFYCSWATAAQAGGVAFTVRKNGVSTALTFTATSGTTGHDTAHTATTAAGDLLDIQIINSNAANATGIVTCGFQENG